MGLVSDGRVHSDLEHAIAIVQLAAKVGFPRDRLFVHAMLDGRDTSPKKGKTYLKTLQKALDHHGVGRIASLVGRFYAMDRDFRWERVQVAYDLLTQGSQLVFPDALQAIEAYYASPSDSSRHGDEFVTPRSIAPNGVLQDRQKVSSGDSLIFFNYRGDRPREISKALVLEDAAWNSIQGGGFDRGEVPKDLFFAGMTRYEAGLPMEVVFEKPKKMPDILAQVLADRGLTQFRCAETEKFPHVTFFFNDYREDEFEGEDRKIVPSPRDVATYDLKPEMSAPGVTEEMIRRIESGAYDLIVLNYANGDMVGHTGSIPAAIAAVEEVDRDVGRIVEAVLDAGGSLVVTADHGNCEQMIDPETGGPHTAHTTYPVDLIVVDDQHRSTELRTGGRLADIAPTLLDLMRIEKPEAMTGVSLLEASDGQSPVT